MLAAAAALVLAGSVPQALAAGGDIGHQDASFAGVGNDYLANPTADKPQSKLWFNNGFWWADMFDSASGTWHIFRLDRATQAWVDTGTRIDDRPTTRGDALWDGTHLYVATNVLAASSSSNVAGRPARLYRYSYTAATHAYRLDPGFPVAINNDSSESLTLDKDSRGVLWATWTQDQKVYVNSTNGTDTSWGAPFVLSAAGASGLSNDDISTLAAYGGSKIALLWGNQVTSTFYVAVHQDGAGQNSWTSQAVLSGSSMADDHLDIKQIQGDAAGHLYAIVKTSLDLTGSPEAIQTELLSLDPGTGAWRTIDFGTVADCHTRPIIVIDSTNQVLNVFATAPSSGDCTHSGTPGTIYRKSAPLGSLSFAPGRGEPVIRDAASPYMNDATGTKQTVTAATGLVVLASETFTQRYWHADLPVPGTVRPVVTQPVVAKTVGAKTVVAKPAVTFTAARLSARNWATIRFTGSGGGVTRWSWRFGDGRTAAVRTAAHRYARAGRYTVTLTGITPKGVRVTSTRVIVVSRPR